jgi:DNA-binding winged helix-turn-helix (wHTH) protein
MLFHFDGHMLDPERRQLWRGETVVALEPQVFDLLVYLVRNRNHVVSKSELIETVWGGRIVSDATIDSRVKAARQAVGDNGARQLVIRTMPRKGVRLVAEVREQEEDAPRQVLTGKTVAENIAFSARLDWLRGLGLEQYASLFIANEIDEVALPGLTAQDLKEMGITSIGHRRRLLDAIAALRPGLPAADVTIASTASI